MPAHGAVHADHIRDGMAAARQHEAPEKGCEADQRGGSGEFVGEMGLFIESDRREVILRTRTQCELAEVSYERLHQLFLGTLSPMRPSLLYAIGAQLSRRLLDTSRKPAAWPSWTSPTASSARCTTWRASRKP